MRNEEVSLLCSTECVIVSTCLVEASGTLQQNVFIPVWLKLLALWKGML